jgi:hypothetical protein
MRAELRLSQQASWRPIEGRGGRVVSGGASGRSLMRRRRRGGPKADPRAALSPRGVEGERNSKSSPNRLAASRAAAQSSA